MIPKNPEFFEERVGYPPSLLCCSAGASHRSGPIERQVKDFMMNLRHVVRRRTLFDGAIAHNPQFDRASGAHKRPSSDLNVCAHAPPMPQRCKLPVPACVATLRPLRLTSVDASAEKISHFAATFPGKIGSQRDRQSARCSSGRFLVCWLPGRCILIGDQESGHGNLGGPQCLTILSSPRSSLCPGWPMLPPPVNNSRPTKRRGWPTVIPT